jgi:hypothetical protein
LCCPEPVPSSGICMTGSGAELHGRPSRDCIATLSTTYNCNTG